MNTIKHLLNFATATVILSACGNQQESNEQESNVIEITTQQFATDTMQLGKMVNKTFESTINCFGSIVTLPNGMAKVSAPVNGIIKNIQCFNGQSVSKYQPLMEIAGAEIIDIQRDFAEASANYTRIKNEYERVKTLYDEKVTSEKDFILAEDEFKTSLAKYNGLKLKIEAIGFSISKIENGNFYSSYLIKSPIDGYISRLSTNIGSYIDSQTELLEIINPDLLQVKLSVFPKDIKAMKKGNLIRFKSASNKDVHISMISSIGVAIDNETKSIDCYASITTKNLNPFVNEFVEAEIITSIDTSLALPSDAIIKAENGYFVLVLNKQEAGKYLFNKIEVKIGIQYEGFTEITEPKIDGLILTDGVYNITL